MPADHWQASLAELVNSGSETDSVSENLVESSGGKCLMLTSAFKVCVHMCSIKDKHIFMCTYIT